MYNDENQKHWQDFLQGGAHYIYEKWSDFIVINFGQDSNIIVM
jgi:hypothetical protein